MEIGYSLLLAAISASFGAIIGSSLILLFEHQGRVALTRQCGISLAIALAVLTLPGLIWGFGTYSDFNQWTGGLGIVSAFSLGVAGFAFGVAYFAPARVEKYIDVSSRMVPFALKNFDEIDYDDDQIISVKDIDRAMQQKAFKGAEVQELLLFMRQNMHDIGHDVGTHHVGPNSGGSVTVSVINRADIERYAATTAEKYARWRQ